MSELRGAGASVNPIPKSLGYTLIIVWSFVVCCGTWTLWTHQSTQGDVGQTPSLWPSGTGLVASDTEHTIVMFAHPFCPCTEASLSELESIVQSTDTRATLVFGILGEPTNLHAASTEPDWTNARLIERARSQPKLTVVTDPTGNEATRFGARTSGYCVVYDSSGRLIFRGGITQGRGHVGPNGGKSTLVSIVNDATDPQSDAQPSWQTSASSSSLPANNFPVFGCPLDTCERILEEASPIQ